MSFFIAAITGDFGGISDFLLFFWFLLSVAKAVLVLVIVGLGFLYCPWQSLFSFFFLSFLEDLLASKPYLGLDFRTMCRIFEPFQADCLGNLGSSLSAIFP